MSNQATIDRAYSELAEAKKAARASRRAFSASPISAFVRTMRAVITQYLTARFPSDGSQGVTREDGIRGIEEELRGAWPRGVSKFTPSCGSCDDTGYVDHVCWDKHRCGREVCAKNPDRQHAFVEPCGCARGDKMRTRVRTTEDAIAAAGRTQKKPRGFARLGA